MRKRSRKRRKQAAAKRRSKMRHLKQKKKLSEQAQEALKTEATAETSEAIDADFQEDPEENSDGASEGSASRTNSYGGKSFSGLVHPTANTKVLTPELRSQSTKRALLKEIGLMGITNKDNVILNSLLLELE